MSHVTRLLNIFVHDLIVQIHKLCNCFKCCNLTERCSSVSFPSEICSVSHTTKPVVKRAVADRSGHWPTRHEASRNIISDISCSFISFNLPNSECDFPCVARSASSACAKQTVLHLHVTQSQGTTDITRLVTCCANFKPSSSLAKYRFVFVSLTKCSETVGCVCE